MNRKALALLLVASFLLPAMPALGGGTVDAVSLPDGPADGPGLDTRVVDGGRFMENLGQWEPHVAFVARCSFGDAVFGPDGVMYDVRTEDGGHRVKVAFDTNRPSEPEGIGDLGSRTSYFYGNDPDGWVSGATSYRELLYVDVWPGVDVRYYFHGDALKYDVIVGASADPSSIGFTVVGHEGLDISADRLDIRLPGGLRLQDRDLVAHYSDDGEAMPVEFSGDGRDGGYGFAVDKEPGRELVIDPIVMLSSTFLGGTYDDGGKDVEVDAAGNIYIIGETVSFDYPTSTGAYCSTYIDEDIVVSKLSHNCSDLLFSTFIGGSRRDVVGRLALDPDGGVYVLGSTDSHDFPVTAGALSTQLNLGVWPAPADLFVFKLVGEGTALDYSTYVGGKYDEELGDIEVLDGQALVVGSTSSPDFPREAGSNDTGVGALFFILNADGTAVVDTQFWEGYGASRAYALEVASDGDVVVGGFAQIYRFPTTPGAYQSEKQGALSGWVSRYSPARDEIEFTTFVGGGYDQLWSLALDDQDDIYFGGHTINTTAMAFPFSPGAWDTTMNGRSEAFVGKINANGTELLYSTFLGGEYEEFVIDLVVTSDGKAVATGFIRDGENYGVTDGCQDPLFEGTNEGYLLILDQNATAPVYSSFLGGTYHDELHGVALTPDDTVVVVGRTNSADLPVSEDAFQTKITGNIDSFVSVIGCLYPPSAPRNLTATGGDGNITLNWDAPLQDGGYPVQSYALMRGPSADELALLAVVDDGTGYMDVDVDYGEYNFYAVFAFNGKGISPMSNVASARSLALPDTPVNFTGVVHSNLIRLSWEAPNFTGGLPLVGYTLYKGVLGGEMEVLVMPPPEVLVYTDLDLVDRTTYVYELASATEHGESVRSTLTLRTTGLATPPHNLTHTYGDLFIKLRWDEPEDLYGLPIKAYKVYRVNVTGTAVPVGSTTAGKRTFVDNDVEFGVVYTYYVTAENLKGESLPSAVIEARTMTRPWPPAGANASALERFVRVTWSPPEFDGASPLLGYKVYVGTDPEDFVCIGTVYVEGLEEPVLAFLHDMPYDGVVRHYYVTAVNAEGESDRSPYGTITLYDVPSPPLDLEVISGDGELTLSWVAPEHDGGTALRSYILYRGDDLGGDLGGDLVSLATIPASMESYVDATVVNGVGYTYRLTATNLAGESNRSSEVSGIPAGLPDPPADVTAFGLDGSAKLSWQPPSYTGGLPVTGYRVYTVGDGSEIELLTEVGPDVLEFIVDGLENGKVYLFAVAALSSVGESEGSGLVEAMPVGPPSAPVGLVALWMGDHVQVTWSAPLDHGGSPVTGYSIRRDDWEAGNWTEVPVGAMLFHDDDVEWEGTYNYTVVAWRDADEGPPATVTITVPQEPEDPPETAPVSMIAFLVIGVVLGVVVASVLYSRRGKDGEG